MADVRSVYHDVINMFYSILAIITFVCCAVCYGAVWWKIRATAQLMKVITKENGAFYHKKRSNNRSARIMSCFVLAFLSQWFAYIVYSVWSYLQTPPVWLLGINVCLCNMGGLFNFLAYTYVRRQHRSPDLTIQRTGNTNTNDKKGRCTQIHVVTSGISFCGNLFSPSTNGLAISLTPKRNNQQSAWPGKEISWMAKDRIVRLLFRALVIKALVSVSALSIPRINTNDSASQNRLSNGKMARIPCPWWREIETFSAWLAIAPLGGLIDTKSQAIFY